MNWIKLAILPLLGMFGGTETKMLVYQGDKRIGESMLSQKILSTGSKQISVTMQLTSKESQTFKVRQESVYDQEGNPVRKIQEVFASTGKRLSSKLVIFTSEGAEVAINEDGKATNRVVKLAKGAPRSNPSEFWFIRDKPKISEKVIYYRFDPTSERWVLSETTYLGTKNIRFGKIAQTVHEIRTSEGTVLLDAKGDPILIETASVRMQREGG